MTSIKVSTPTTGTLDALARKKGDSKGTLVAEMTRGNSININPKDLWIEPNFNIREICPDHVEGFKQSYMNDKMVPPIEVKLVLVTNLATGEEEQKVKVIEGHHRTHGIWAAIEAGKSIPLITVMPFTGNDIEEVTRMVVSSQGRQLSHMERAHAYNRMVNLGISQTEISKRVHDHLANISNLLKLVSAPQQLQTLINNGDIAINRVHSLVREFNSFDKVLAAVIIEIEDRQERKAAKKSGGKAYTGNTSIYRKTSLKKIETQSTQNVVSSLGERLESIELGEGETATIELTAEEIQTILALRSSIQAVETHNKEVALNLAKRSLEVDKAEEVAVETEAKLAA